jgi:hypothetical protein
MPNIPRIVSTPVDCVSFFTLRFALRLLVCVLLTSLDAAVIALFGGTLYRPTANHLSWFIGVSLIFGALLASLIRVWALMLRGQSS